MEPLLSPLTIGSCLLQNRLIFTAASLCRSPDGFVHEDTIQFYRARAKGGAGLVLAGGAGVDPDRQAPGMMQVCSDACIPGLAKLAHSVQEAGSKCFLQLLHEGAYAHPLPEGLSPLAPSSYQSGLTGIQTQEMSLSQIRQAVSYFADAAQRARQAGFDGVEICASVGYLPAEFLSAATNHRTDAYGGPLENRMRFLLEIVEAIQTNTGNDFPILVRLSGADMIPHGNRLEDTVKIAKALQTQGVAALSITGGWHETRIPQITGHVPRGGYRFLAKAVKEQVSIPVIACNRMDIPSGRKALLEGCCDAVGLCRPFLADPDLGRKLRKGREPEIRSCLSCNQECLDRVFAGKPVGCAVNPFVGQEDKAWIDADQGKHILVIGAGISGMAYAALAARKNRVEVWEKSGRWGGTARLLAKLPHWQDVSGYADSLYSQCLRHGVAFSWYREASPSQLCDLLQSHTYDKVVIAAGAQPEPPAFPVDPEARAYPLWQWVEQCLPLGKHTVVLGNDFRGLEAALFCAKQRRLSLEQQEFFSLWTSPEEIGFPTGQETSVVCLGPLKKPGSGMARSVLWACLLEAKKEGIQCVGEAEILRVTPQTVQYRQHGEEKEIPADTVLFAHRWQPAPAFRQTSWPAELLPRIVFLGDAKTPGRISEAVRSAVQAAGTGTPAEM